MSLALQLKDYRLTTAEILYRLPDHPGILQSYIWQELDLAPRFPVLHRFLDFWHRELDGKVHSVRVASAKLIKPASVSQPGGVSPAALMAQGLVGVADGFRCALPILRWYGRSDHRRNCRMGSAQRKPVASRYPSS